jgi:hypothetical protein
MLSRIAVDRERFFQQKTPDAEVASSFVSQFWIEGPSFAVAGMKWRMGALLVVERFELPVSA